MDKLFKPKFINKNKKNKDNNIDFEIINKNTINCRISNLIIFKLIIEKLKKFKLKFNNNSFTFNIENLDNITKIIENFVKSNKSENFKLNLIPKWILNFVLKNEKIKDNLKFKIKKENIEIDYKKDNLIIFEDLNDDLIKNLYPFQIDGVKFGIENKCRFLWGDEMGTGKTIQSISLTNIYKEDWPVIIICPSSLKYNWKNEIIQWNKDVEEKDILVIDDSKETIHRTEKYYILSYQLAVNYIKDLTYINSNFIIIDEAHYLKNINSQRSKILTPFIKKCKRVILLTGTPALNKPKEIFNLLNIIRPDIFIEFKSFGKRYCDPKVNNFNKFSKYDKLDYSGSSNLKELNFILNNGIMIRRLKSNVLNDLPNKIRQKVIIDVDQNIVKNIKSLLKDNEELNFENLEKIDYEKYYGDKNQNFQNNLFSKIFKLSGISKIKGVLNFLECFIKKKKKFIVFAHHKDIIKEIENFYIKNEIKYIKIDGTTKSFVRNELVQSFQNDDSVQAAILSILACHSGLNLTKSNLVIFAEMIWTPSHLIQCESRCHRNNQKNIVICYYLYGEDTIDSLIWDKIYDKFKTLTQFVDGKDDVLIMEKKSLEKIQNEITTDKKENLKKFDKSDCSFKKKLFHNENIDTDEIDDFLKDFDEN